MTTAKIQAITAERLVACLTKEQRRRLPAVLAAKGAWSRHAQPLIEAARVVVDNLERRERDTRGEWAAHLPELTLHYAAGWQFAGAVVSDREQGAVIYLWRNVEVKA